MPEPLDFDPITIHYNPECLEAKFLWNLIKIKGARPISRYYPHERPAITVCQQTIEPLPTIIEFLDTRFVARRVLPLHPLERAAMQMLVTECLSCHRLYVTNPFILGRNCSLADLAYATATHNLDHLKITLHSLSHETPNR